MSKLLPIIQTLEAISGTHIQINWQKEFYKGRVDRAMFEKLKLASQGWTYVEGGGAYRITGIQGMDISGKDKPAVTPVIPPRGDSPGSSSSKKETT